MGIKKIRISCMIVIFVLSVLLFQCVSACCYPNSDIDIQQGDILIGTPKFKKLKWDFINIIAGHIGIVIDNEGQFASIFGSVEKTTINPLRLWLQEMKNTSVMRMGDAEVGNEAAEWAKVFCEGDGKVAEYSICSAMNDTKKVYCSKLVWLAYYNSGMNILNLDEKATAYIHPFQFLYEPSLVKVLKIP